MTAVEVESLESGYGKMKILDGVDLAVRDSEIVTVVGPNGAGKTTLLRVISGVLPRWSGTIRLWGEPVENEPPHKRVTRSIAYVPEGARVFGDLTVEENLEMGAFNRRDRAAVREDLQVVLELFPALGQRLKANANHLSGGQRQMLAIGRGLMSGSKLLLLDEPSLGLAPILVDELFEKLTAIRRMGTTILLVEQNARKAFEIADRGYVLSGGKIVLDGSVDELREDELLRGAFLGG